MDIEKGNFKLTDETRMKVETSIGSNINYYFREALPSYVDEDNEKKIMIYRYNVSMFDDQIKFTTYMSEDEVRMTCKYAVDIIEELMLINNSGLTKEQYKLIYDRNKIMESEYDNLKEIWNRIKTERLEKIMTELIEFRGISDLSAYTISLPYLRSIIINMYDRIVDRFDDKDMFYLVVSYIARGIMRMGEE